MRDGSTYRAARRNAARGGVWSDENYYEKHLAKYGRRTVLRKRPSRYHPLKSIKEYLAGIGAKMSPARLRVVVEPATRARSGSRGQ